MLFSIEIPYFRSDFRFVLAHTIHKLTLLYPVGGWRPGIVWSGIVNAADCRKICFCTLKAPQKRKARYCIAKVINEAIVIKIESMDYN